MGRKPVTIGTYPLSSLYTKFREHRRLKVFVHKGTRCVCCRVEGTKLLKTRFNYKSGEHADHVDLFTNDNVMMTVDHMLPKSKKGSNKLRNKQPMCCICNSKKDSTYTPVLGRFSWFYRLMYLLKRK